jgi:hypothetical protein
MSNNKANLAGLAALITSLAAAGGVLFNMWQASGRHAQQNQTQEQGYTVIKDSLEKFSKDVSDDLEDMKKQIHALDVEVAVLKDRTRRMQTASVERAQIDEPSPPTSRKVELKSFSEIQESAAASIAAAK